MIGDEGPHEMDHARSRPSSRRRREWRLAEPALIAALMALAIALAIIAGGGAGNGAGDRPSSGLSAPGAGAGSR